ncbi:beta-N-acetylhexosaminidase [Paenibacillus psychroresistens]|uniref:Beta-N-acetylhexosaminidase n=1 Tax=Paenibacillus psychroresistens TaxID=1778678 RepID=A0A6B8RFB6_9BACL|nr:beta-N-acetylhexosaminidase [Paenibacillus psychroresistens]QGQ94056.1 beta-N-acetylhexosaminidase [Paenibacillus psychroresistens]
MSPNKRISVFLISICVITSGCSSKNNLTTISPRPSATESSSPTQIPSSSPAPTASPTPTPDPIQEQIKLMTLDEKIGQMVIVGVEGTAVSEQTRDLIDHYHVGGIILYSNNIVNKTQTTDFLNELKQANTNLNKVPLWLGVDQEGGRVSRMPNEYTKLPTNRAIGKINKPEFSNKLGNILGKELQSVGFNMDYAPVMDINSNPNNPVIGDRSFGADANLVSKLGVQTMLGIQAQKIAAVVKHFPGHGDTSVDSHLDLPIVQTDLKRLRSFEWLPFEAAIDNNVDAVMVAHILLPKIDPDHPASFSKTVITDYLRNELKFNGVVMTDDMTMGGIVNHYELKDAAAQSINAGSDVIMVAHEYEKAKEVLSNLKSKVETGELPEERINQSVYRILKLKLKYAIQDQALENTDITPINDEIKRVLKQYMK